MEGCGQCIRGRRLWKKTKLPGSEDVINSEMLEDVLVDESFEEFTNNWLKGDRTVARSRLAVTRFKDWYTFKSLC